MRKYIKEMGWLFLPPNYVAYDKQKHGAVSVCLTLMTFFIPQELGITTLMATFFSVILVSVIGFGIEYYQKWFQPHRHFDVKDATIMIKVNIILIALLYIIELSVGTVN
jgi:hypothetical protein